MATEHVLGIDLGTTNCCVAVMDGASPQVIRNRVGYATTPSVVAVTADGKELIGQLAQRQAISNPEHTVAAAKRFIGRRMDSPEVQHAIEHSAFKIVAGANNEAMVELQGRRTRVEEISAMLLREMRATAEESLESKVEKAVVTVPAYFNDSQRQAVRDAGKIAGLNVIRIINEPTAAALAYGFGRAEPQTIAVYDLGGGTFDISIVRIQSKGHFQVISTTGDSYLGGEDFDNRLMDWLIRGFHAHHQVDLTESPVALQRLRSAVQKAKCDLSALSTVEIQLPFLVSDGPKAPLHMDYSINRDQLEQLTKDLIARTLDICDHAMNFARIDENAIDDVVLVGGMTRMPAVQRAVQERFGKAPSKRVHPDEAVALGAAIQGASMVQELEDVELQDVTAHALGILAAGGTFQELIPSNTTLPHSCSRIFTTNRDQQVSVQVVVMQGDPSTASMERLGEFALTGLRPAKAGELEVDVRFEIDDDGIFKVSATDLETGKDQSVEVIPRSAVGGSDESLSESPQDKESERKRDEEIRRLGDLLEGLERLLHKVGEEAHANPAVIATAKKAQQVITHVRRTVDTKPEASDFSKEAELVARVRKAIERMLK
ncbi:MAG: molecular chaperone DnaK [Myxococcota bacterium]